MMLNQKIIHTSEAPEPIGPYSQAIQSGSLLFLSGQIALDPDTEQLISTTIEDETKQVFKNIEAILSASGLALSDIIKATIYLTDMADFPAVNSIYAEQLGPHKPARACVAVRALPRNARIEIDAIAQANVREEP